MVTFRVAPGVYGIDVGLLDAGVGSVYVFEDTHPTLVDTGAAATADTLINGLNELGLLPGLSNVVLSHVHTDHAGAAGRLTREHPTLTVYLHELTAPHLIDPARLIQSSRDAMGEHFDRVGAQEPVPDANVTTVTNAGLRLDTGEHALELIHAPGHSPDHLAVWHPRYRLLFAAECLGLYLPRADHWLPPATLPSFNPDQVHDAIHTLRALDPDTIVFPHYGVWPHEPARAFDTAARELDRYNDHILRLYHETNSIPETERRLNDTLVDLSPPYDPAVESFFTHMLTHGYLRHHNIT